MQIEIADLKSICKRDNLNNVISIKDDDKEDIIQDFVSIITSYCAKIYGKRRSSRKTEYLIKELSNDKI